MYRVVIAENALEKLRKIPKDDVKRFYSKIEFISENPFADIPFVKRLKSSLNFRFRFGDYRCVYSVFNDILIIEVIDIGLAFQFSIAQAVILEEDACVRRRIHVSVVKTLDPSLRSRMTARWENQKTMLT